MKPGKKFEQDIKNSCPDGQLVYKLRDSSGAWDQSEDSKTRFTPRNISDFIFYTGKLLFFVECKSFKGKSISYDKNIKKTQLEGLEKVCNEPPNTAIGLIFLNFRELSETYSVTASAMRKVQERSDRKSFSLEDARNFGILINQQIKRTRWGYDLRSLFDEYDIWEDESPKQWKGVHLSRKNEFLKWMSEKYPDITLTDWQLQFARTYFRGFDRKTLIAMQHGRGLGKRFLLSKISEFEKDTCFVSADPDGENFKALDYHLCNWTP